MAARQYADAAVEFQKILDHRGLVALDPIGALAHLQLARVFVADADLPALKQAKAEYARLQ
jgi:hypothetical protein